MQGVVSKPFLRNLFFRISYLTQLGVKLVFVVEGEAPELKWEAMWKRQQARFPGQPAGRGRGQGKASRRNFKSCLKECCQMLDILGVPHIQSRGEAEALCAALDEAGLVDGCLTDDGDVFLYGAKTVYRNFTMNTQDPHVECYCMTDIETKLGLDRNKLVGLALLLGCDYLPKGVPGVGPEKAIKMMKSFDRDVNILERFSEWSISGKCLCSVEEVVRRKALGVAGFPQQKVIDEFLIVKDKCPSRIQTWKRPTIQPFQAFASIKLDWPEDYSLEKVLSLLTLWDMQHIVQSNATTHISWSSQVFFSHPPQHKLVLHRQVLLFSVNTTYSKDYYVTIEEQGLFSRCFAFLAEKFEQTVAEKREKKRGKTKKKDTTQNTVNADLADGLTNQLQNLSIQDDLTRPSNHQTEGILTRNEINRSRNAADQVFNPSTCKTDTTELFNPLKNSKSVSQKNQDYFKEHEGLMHFETELSGITMVTESKYNLSMQVQREDCASSGSENSDGEELYIPLSCRIQQKLSDKPGNRNQVSSFSSHIGLHSPKNNKDLHSTIENLTNLIRQQNKKENESSISQTAQFTDKDVFTEKLTATDKPNFYESCLLDSKLQIENFYPELIEIIDDNDSEEEELPSNTSGLNSDTVIGQVGMLSGRHEIDFQMNPLREEKPQMNSQISEKVSKRVGLNLNVKPIKIKEISEKSNGNALENNETKIKNRKFNTEKMNSTINEELETVQDCFGSHETNDVSEHSAPSLECGDDDLGIVLSVCMPTEANIDKNVVFNTKSPNTVSAAVTKSCVKSNRGYRLNFQNSPESCRKSHERMTCNIVPDTPSPVPNKSSTPGQTIVSSNEFTPGIQYQTFADFSHVIRLDCSVQTPNMSAILELDCLSCDKLSHFQTRRHADLGPCGSSPNLRPRSMGISNSATAENMQFSPNVSGQKSKQSMSLLYVSHLCPSLSPTDKYGNYSEMESLIDYGEFNLKNSLMQSSNTSRTCSSFISHTHNRRADLSGNTSYGNSVKLEIESADHKYVQILPNDLLGQDSIVCSDYLQTGDCSNGKNGEVDDISLNSQNIKPILSMNDHQKENKISCSTFSKSDTNSVENSLQKEKSKSDYSDNVRGIIQCGEPTSKSRDIDHGIERKIDSLKYFPTVESSPISLADRLRSKLSKTSVSVLRDITGNTNM
ncbi:hypothetical protein ScPMuIL_016554 [Solemya velum]